jgi:hypothetical protein
MPKFTPTTTNGDAGIAFDGVHAFWDTFRALHRETATFMARRTTEDTAHLCRLMACKDVGEVLDLQQKWIDSAQAAYQDEASKLMRLTFPSEGAAAPSA